MKANIKKWICISLTLALLCGLFAVGAAAAMRGDVDKDGTVQPSDARLALRRSVLLENYQPGSSQFIAADMDGDGAVSAGDARSVLRVAAGLTGGMEEITPAEKTPDETFHNAMLAFALALFRQTAADDAGENLLVSPLSVMTALSMAANGARGETLAQLEQALGGLTAEDLNAYLHMLTEKLPNTEYSRLHVANSLWVNNRVRGYAQKPFLQNMLACFGAGINACDFDQAGVDAVNNWVKENTDGMIDSILDEPDPEILMLLMNALAFDAKWADPFEETAVKKATFTRADGTQEFCDMMRGIEHIYLEDEDAVGFVKPYLGGGYRFAALLPNEDIPLADYIASLTPEKLSALLNGAQQEYPVRIGLPEFTFDYSVKLNDALKAMGVKMLFDPFDCDLSGMFPREIGAYVSDVLHKTFIEVNTEGTRAAAVTAIFAKANAMPLFEYKTVVLDRPFVFLITMGEADTPVFIGAINSCGK